MSEKAAVLIEIEAAFGGIPRPEHFTNFAHCEECFEHDQTLRSCERGVLTREQLGTPGWDPVTFCTPEAKAYLFPALARMALADVDVDDRYDWYACQLLNHLYSGYQYNDFYRYCDARQRKAIASLLGFIMDTHADVIDAYNAADEFIRCYELWSGLAENPPM